MASSREEGASQQVIADELGISQVRVSIWLRTRLGFPPERNGEGPTHSAWKGGRFETDQGYVWVWVDPADPLSVVRDGRGYVLEHRLVMARSLGRPLTRIETVHHINNDPGDNRLENLQLRSGAHGTGASMLCLDCGSVNVGPVPLK